MTSALPVLVRVRWLDAMTYTGWKPLDGAIAQFERCDMVHEDTGWLVAENDAAILLVSSRGPVNVGVRKVIPRSCLESVEPV